MLQLFLLVLLASILFANGDHQITIRISPSTDIYQVNVFCIQRHDDQLTWNHEIDAGTQPIGQQQVLLHVHDLHKCLDNNFNFTIRTTNRDRHGNELAWLRQLGHVKIDFFLNFEFS